MKVGTGYGDTIQGHVYLRNAAFLDPPPPPATNTNPNPHSDNAPSNTSDAGTTTTATTTAAAATATSPLSSHAGAKDGTDAKHRKWLIYLQNKLYLYCGETVQKTSQNVATPNGIITPNNTTSPANTATNSSATTKAENVPSGYILHSISTHNLREDVSTKLTLSSSNVSTHDAIIGDGRFLYVLKSKGQVEVFDPLATLNSDGHLVSVSSFTLTAPSPTTSPSSPPTTPPLPFPSIFLEKGGWYTTGRQLVCVVAPETLGSTEHLSRVWTLPSGVHSSDITSKAKPPSPAACYDVHNNVVWCYDETNNKIAEYANSGPAGAVESDTFPSPYVALSPENILSSQVANTGMYINCFILAVCRSRCF